MKRMEKNQLSKEKILNAAVLEFGTRSYEAASLNNICQDNDISKGLIYHYFDNKEELYLCCIRDCFHHIVEYLAMGSYDFTNFQIGMNQYLKRRYEFFQTFPYYNYLFFTTMIQPPTPLESKIKEIRKEFDSQSTNFYKSILEHMDLRDSISKEEAMDYFLIFQEMFNGYFQKNIQNISDFHSIVEYHELKLFKMLDMMLYGIVKERI